MQDVEHGDRWVTLAEAAGLLGCSVDTVRRRLRKGALEARQVPTQHGPAWMVRLGETPTVMPTLGSAPRQDATTLEPESSDVPSTPWWRHFSGWWSPVQRMEP